MDVLVAVNSNTAHTHSAHDEDAGEGVVWSINNKFKTNVKKVRWRPMNMFINKFQLESEVMVGGICVHSPGGAVIVDMGGYR